MKTVRVGYDFDEPIYPWYDLAHKASLAAGIALPEHEPTSWAPHETYGCTLEEWVAVLDAEVLNPKGMYCQPFQPGVVDSIKRLYNRGYEIHIVTARGSFGTNHEIRERIKRITQSSIIREGLPHTTLNFAKEKVSVYKRLGLDYFLDDAPHNFQPMLEAGCNVFLLDERWNQNVDEEFYPFGRRVHSTEEYNQMIMDREQLERPNSMPMAEYYRR